MKKLFSKVLLSGLLVMSVSSCASLYTPAGMGSLYTDFTHGEQVTSNSLGSKVGTAEANNILGLVLVGDASVETAAKKAGIKNISHVDCKKKSILGLFSTYTVVVYGE